MPAEVARVRLALLPERTLVRIEHPPFHILLVRIGDDLHAIEDACPHSGVSLCRGTLDGHVVTCPGHGWQVDVRTGRVVKPHGVGEANPCYAVTRHHDEVIVSTRG